MRLRHYLSANLLVVLTVGCGSSAHRTQQLTAATSPPRSTRTTFAISDAGASFIPNGFVAVHTAKGPMPGHVPGPVPGSVMDGQYFEGPRGQALTITVHRGLPLRVFDWLHSSTRRIHGYVTYVGNDPVTKQREFTWAVTPTIVVFVGGLRMSDEVLRRIADGITIPAS
jgi:hypothetical protein